MPLVVVAGGGPAGVFAAIRCRELAPRLPVLVLEKGPRPLAKLAVSGGGRCNVTHACFDPRELAARYPRGGRELPGPLARFGPAETVAWFAGRGVALKTEPDGRMFPETDSARTVVDCLLAEARRLGVRLRTCCALSAARSVPGGLALILGDGAELACDRLLIATGGARSARDTVLPASLGHTVREPVPSLFGFRIPDPLLAGLAGTTVPDVILAIAGGRLRQRGAVLVTHEGLSGPAALLLSSWGARELHARGHRFELDVAWLGTPATETVRERLRGEVAAAGRRRVGSRPPAWAPLPRRLWSALVARAQVPAGTTWADLTRTGRDRLAAELTRCRLAVSGRASFRDEFVTCGGVDLSEVDFRTMASRLVPGLHLAGEALDIDGPTGGYNLQAAWTTGRLAGAGLASGKGRA